MAGYKMKFSGKKHNKGKHRFDEECISNKKSNKMALVKYKVKDGDVRRVKYWECIKQYNIWGLGEGGGGEKQILLEKQAPFLNNVIKQKDVKKGLGSSEKYFEAKILFTRF
jgi:hypothetical protein